jgi:hypothetical protein
VRCKSPSFKSLTASSPKHEIQQGCFVEAAPHCSLLDIACICSHGSFGSYIGSCTANRCPPDQQASSFQFVQELCAASGVEFNFFVPSGSGAPSLSRQTSMPNASGSPTASGDPTALEPAPGTHSRSPTTPSYSASRPLSAGAKAGIAIGAVLIAVLLLLGGYFLWRRHKRNFSHALGRPEGGTDKEVNSNGLAIGVSPVFYEIDGTPRYTSELEDRHAALVARQREGRSELSPSGRNAEMEARTTDVVR